ncbi:uncharacterized protein CXorf38-like [Dreissena polymorpha]|uniref:uncharacterized protein CXorf38-like n=1 Tax=Dreissena polymorpha TaxID=45954 RepID=UPI002263F7FA|nr:uncharacterized protein CXorf38-like [Dreissena polymorpha]XP_052220607.1 uncharacterized protein CXorf38-like [Dreissena polymorpha]
MDTEFRNWIKACLAIKCVKDGLVPLVEKYTNIHYTSNKDEVVKVCGIPTYLCKTCDVTELEPYHKTSKITCKFRKCGCKNDNMKKCQENRACGVVYDQIQSAHIRNDPSWPNTNCDKWSSSAWEQMKCYIFTPGYKQKTDISCADVTALIQICLNYRPLRTIFNLNVVDLEEVLRCRNDIYHSSTLKVSNGDLNYFLSTMKTFLKLNVFQDFKDEVERNLEILGKLENDKFEVSKENELDARKDAMGGIQESIAEMLENQKQVGQNIEVLISVNDSHMQEVQNCMRQIKEQYDIISTEQCSQHREIRKQISDQTQNLEEIREKQVLLGASMSDLGTDMKKGMQELLTSTFRSNKQIFHHCNLFNPLFLLSTSISELFHQGH